jgi:RNA polymerase sigma-70 factor (ECF subfamily)
MTEQDDSILVKHALEGDRSGFEGLVRKYLKPIFNLALRMVNDSEQAADIAQTTFIKAYENLSTFNRDLKFFSWLYRIAINESLNVLAKQKQRDEFPADAVSCDPMPDEIIHTTERNEIIQQALMKLPSDQRSVIVMRHFLDFSYVQIGSTLGISEKTVKSRLFTARQRLKELLLNKGL